MSARKVLILAALLFAASSTDAEAQTTSAREGVWFNIGMGVGSLGCSDCAGERITGPSGGIALGGTISRGVLIGAFSNGWVKSEDGATITAGSLVLGVRLYPSDDAGFFILGGVGVGRVDVAVTGFGSAGANGAAALLGLGWDIPLSRGVSLTPFWNGVGLANADGDANFGQIGIGLTIH
jgi:hypothetical protein